ncbi:MAG: M20/M25/M40 family metallo-hydrolase [Candidatus Limivicinus sp.]
MKYEEQLSRLIRCETISEAGVENREKFEAFHRVLFEVFPLFHENVTVEEFHSSLVMRWKGRAPDRAPVLAMSHHDVVEAPGEWKYPAFSGAVAEGRVWGRGTLDTKNNLWAMICAAEELMREGFRPACDIYFISPCNEETTGEGAQEIVAAFKSRNIHPKFMLDEGGYIISQPLPGAEGLFAMVGVAEKSCIDIKFTARGNGGHASNPGPDTALVRLGKFMAAAEKDKKLFPAQMHPVTAAMLGHIAPHLSGALKFLFSHISATKALLTRLMPKVSTVAGGLLKTTLAFTMAGASDGANVLPQEAWVVGNMRASIHQGPEDSVKAAADLAKKFDIETEVISPGVKSTPADLEGEGYRLVEDTIHKIFPGVEVTPYILLGATDSRYFEEICGSCIRFAPFIIDDQQFNSLHAVNENINIETLPGAVKFFREIFREV